MRCGRWSPRGDFSAVGAVIRGLSAAPPSVLAVALIGAGLHNVLLPYFGNGGMLVRLWEKGATAKDDYDRYDVAGLGGWWLVAAGLALALAAAILTAPAARPLRWVLTVVLLAVRAHAARDTNPNPAWDAHGTVAVSLAVAAQLVLLWAVPAPVDRRLRPQPVGPRRAAGPSPDRVGG